ncbi:MAG: glycosyltransferase family 2 protein [Lachnospiraceae bacterium]|jgi:dolichol-phosphate mannosyltransferase|nr:glycosyltransferase family 2 protein [Lachnospiraceae bacterium]
MKKISLVVSVYNEEQVLQIFYDTITEVLKTCIWNYEIVFVNDGSVDKSDSIIKSIAEQDSRIKYVKFSRNFGHEAAMIAGIDNASGDGIICMDADLQHPPEYINSIIEKFEEGYEVISMVRTANKDAGLLKNITSSAFYKVLNFMSNVKFEENASDFFAISNRVAGVLKTEYREKVRFLRGFVQSVGFKKTTIEYEAADRAAGSSHYSIKKLFKFSINALLSFSTSPLKIGAFTGCFVGLLGLILMIYTIIMKVAYNAPSGYSTIIVVICFMFAILFIVVGIIGEYIAILFQETKGRPIYIVEDKINFIELENDKVN